MYLLKNLELMFVGPNEFLIDGIQRHKIYTVVGYETRKREKSFQGKTVWTDDPYLMIITDKKKLVSLAAFNCEIRIKND